MLELSILESDLALSSDSDESDDSNRLVIAEEEEDRLLASPLKELTLEPTQESLVAQINALPTILPLPVVNSLHTAEATPSPLEKLSIDLTEEVLNTQINPITPFYYPFHATETESNKELTSEPITQLVDTQINTPTSAEPLPVIDAVGTLVTTPTPLAKPPLEPKQVLDAQNSTPTTVALVGSVSTSVATPKSRLNFTSAGRQRLNPAVFFKKLDPPVNRSTALNKIVQHDVNRRVRQPFILPTPAAPPRRIPSPTFARFNPELVCGTPQFFGPPSPAPLPAPQNVTINNYYGTHPPSQPSSWHPSQQTTQPARQTSKQQAIDEIINLSRKQFMKYCARVSQREIDYAVQLRRQYRRPRHY